MHATRCGSVSGAYSFAPFPPKSRACVQYQYLDRSMRHAGNVCALDFAAISLSGLPRSLNRHRRGCGCYIQRLRLNEFTKTKRWRNCKNGLAKVKIIVNWSVRKRKTFENNYSQGRSRMGMPLRYFKTFFLNYFGI